MFFATGEGILVIAILFAWLVSWLVARVVTEGTGVPTWHLFLALAVPMTLAGAIAGPRRAYAFQTALRHLSVASIIIAAAITGVAWLAFRLTTKSRATSALGAISIGLILSASTLAADAHLRSDAAARIATCVDDPSNLAPSGGEGFWYGIIPNLALYVPFGIAVAAAAWRRAPRPVLRTAVVAAALSVAVELYQAAFTTRVCSPGDTLTNTAGATAGAVLLVVLIRRHATRQVDPRQAPAKTDA